MKHRLKALKYIARYHRLDVRKMLSPTSHICRRSVLDFPVSIGSNASIKRSKIGCRTYISRDTHITSTTIGAYCSIGPECLIGGMGRHPTDHFSMSPVTFSRSSPLIPTFGGVTSTIEFDELLPVSIGADVWIGARAIVLDGVSIGHGAVIGANTVVARDVPPYAIVYGSPSRVQRYRFPSETIDTLLATQWWLQAPEELDVESLRRITASQDT